MKYSTVYQRILRYWLAAGFVALLTGLFWLPKHGMLPRLFYFAFALPACLSLLSTPSLVHNLRSNEVIRGYLAFAGWLLLSLWWTESTQAASSAATRPLHVLLLFVGCLAIASNGTRFLRQLLLASAILAALASAWLLSQHFSLPAPRDRLTGGGAFINPLLSSHVFGFFFTFWAASWASQREQRLWYLPGAALMFGAILATGSRTPLFASAIVLLWLLWQGHRRNVFFLVSAIVLALIVVSVLDPQILLQRGLSYRPQLWGMALAQWTEAPWIGRGFNAPFQFPLAALETILEDPHNIALAVALQLGLVGLLLWLVLYFHAFHVLRDCKDGNLAVLVGAMLAYGLGAGMFEGSNFLSRPNENWFLYWIPLALSAACSLTSPALEKRARSGSPQESQ